MQPRSILVRCPSWVGDAVMATPTLRALREAHRDATITLEAPSRLAPLYAGLDSFDHFLPTGFQSIPQSSRTTSQRPIEPWGGPPPMPILGAHSGRRGP